MTLPTPADLLGIATTTGNHFNVGIGRAKAHTDYSLSQLVGGYTSHPEFETSPDGEAVQFQVFTNAKTTSSHTKYPRSELRETNPDGSLASWSGQDGCVFGAVSRVLHLPPKKPWACVGQIHDARSDLVRLQVEGPNLSALKLVCRNTAPGSSLEVVKTVRESYTLGEHIDWRFVVAAGAGVLYLDGVAVQVFPADESGLYCKAGLYLQTNVKDVKESPTEYGLVEILRGSLVCRHGAVVPPVPDPVPTPVPDPTPVPVPSSATKVVLFRHAERPSDPASHVLSPTGLERAKRLVSLFVPTPKAGLATPVRIYASEGTTASLRPLQTVQPLASALGLPIITKYSAAQGKNAGKEIAKLTGVTACCWAHTELPLVVSGLGKISPKPPKSWDSKRFDMVWVFDRQSDGSWRFTQVPEAIMPGDSSSPLKASLLRTVGHVLRRTFGIGN